MDPKLYSAAISGDVDVITSHISNYSTDDLRKLVTPNTNTILHLASQYGKLEAIQVILSKHPSLISQVNSNGDSALHVAARGGFTNVVHVLIACAKELDPVEKDVESKLQSWVGLSRLENNEGDTAVHEATRYNNIQVVWLLLEEDPDFNPLINKSEESPLYLAARRGFSDLIDVIIKARVTPSYVGPNGRTALHGAVFCNSKESTSILLQWDKDKTLVHSEDKYSETPLHYVARLGFADLAFQLLSVDASIAYNANNSKRSTALLVAASAGHLSVVKEIIFHCPSCCEMVDGQGKNILHIAIEHNHKDVLLYLLWHCSNLISRLIIQKDNYGKKPLHLLDTSICFIPNDLKHLLAEKEALIDDDLTSLDFVIHYEDTKSSTKNEIAKNSAPSVDSKESVYARTRKIIDNHIIVAALIATVAFTAGFAMPGGYTQSGSPNQGMAVLARNSVAFQTFVISDALAMLLSTSAVFTYFMSALYNEKRDIEGKILRNYAVGGWLLNMGGVGALIVAFISGTYAVLHYSYSLAVATSVVASSTFLINSAVLFHFFIYKANSEPKI